MMLDLSQNTNTFPQLIFISNIWPQLLLGFEQISPYVAHVILWSLD